MTVVASQNSHLLIKYAINTCFIKFFTVFRVLSCDKTPSWTDYLDIVEKTIEITLQNTNYVILPRLKRRYSAIDEAVKSLGSILAIENLPHYDILPKKVFQSKTDDEINPQVMTKLLLTALRVLPKLPFHLAADKWRLELLSQMNEENPKKINELWWKIR